MEITMTRESKKKIEDFDAKKYFETHIKTGQNILKIQEVQKNHAYRVNHYSKINNELKMIKSEFYLIKLINNEYKAYLWSDDDLRSPEEIIKN